MCQGYERTKNTGGEGVAEEEGEGEEKEELAPEIPLHGVHCNGVPLVFPVPVYVGWWQLKVNYLHAQ